MKDLARDYRKSAEALEARIRTLEHSLVQLPPHRHWGDCPAEYRRLELLIQERDDLLATAQQLEEYYEAEGEMWEECS